MLPLPITMIRNHIVDAIEQNQPETPFPTPTKFSVYVEQYALDNECSLLDAICGVVDEQDMDILDTPKLITRSLKQKLGIEQGIYKPEKKLPLG